MCDNVNNNPFAGLFSTINDAVLFSTQNQRILNESKDIREEKTEDREIHEIHEIHASKPSYDEGAEEVRILAEVFRITNSESQARKANENGERPVFIQDAITMEQTVFQKLMLYDSMIEANKRRTSASSPQDLEQEAIPYLFECYCRLKQYKTKYGSSRIVDTASSIILQHAGTFLQEPGLFLHQNVHNQFMELYESISVQKQELVPFTIGIAMKLQENDNGNMTSVTAAFSPLLDMVHMAVRKCHLVFRPHWFDLLHTFCMTEPLAKLVLAHNLEKKTDGRAYANNVLGSLLTVSCLPRTTEDRQDYFDQPLQQSNLAMERSIFTALDTLSEPLYRVFQLLLKCSAEVRQLTLEWMGDCLEMNASRGKLWNAHNEMLFGTSNCVADGFMLNFGNVLLRLSQRFFIKESEEKFLKIDPTYCAVEGRNEQEYKSRGVHLRGMSSETCLIPTTDGATRPVAKSFGFTTECFFMTHRALDLGYRVVSDKVLRMNQDLARMQRLYNQALVDGDWRVLETLRLDVEMGKYLTLRATVLVPEMLKLLARFHATTAEWLVQVCLDVQSEDGERTDYAPQEYRKVKFPLPETVPDTLRCIPEFVVENTIRFICFLQRFSPNTFEEEGLSFLSPILTEIIVLMESQRRLYNPHLRARLAGGLEALLPTVDDSVMPALPMLGTFHREQLFTTHPHSAQVVANLLQVFVSIEMTGQSVQFEQKFNYRRPMYVVMEYLWKLPKHRANFVALAAEAEANMEAVQPPLFLRFINLLVNDAVFLLDEALSNMAQIRQMLRERESGEWDKLPQQERDQQADYLQHVGMIARFDNILGTNTIHMLKLLTGKITSIFCHPTMVDRIASMLNYLLLQLVGPNKKKFKVNDQKEYAFNPTELVLNICEIYMNLRGNRAFTLAVSQDGRSYRPELFKQAVDVLVRIGGGRILSDLEEFGRSVEAAANEKKEEDEILVDAPEEFLDPIMSTLMTDPVILPSSRITIDRQTIARHLLSDQTDPFNRSPLTMDMVKSNTELQQKIQEWVQQKKETKAAQTSQESSQNLA